MPPGPTRLDCQQDPGYSVDLSWIPLRGQEPVRLRLGRGTEGTGLHSAFWVEDCVMCWRDQGSLSNTLPIRPHRKNDSLCVTSEGKAWGCLQLEAAGHLMLCRALRAEEWMALWAQLWPIQVGKLKFRTRMSLSPPGGRSSAGPRQASGGPRACWRSQLLGAGTSTNSAVHG